MARYLSLALFALALLFQACGGSGSQTGGLANTPAATPTAAPLPDASALLKRLSTQDGCKEFTAEMVMQAVSSDGKRDQVEFRIQRKYSADGAKTFLTVLAPKEDADKALLAVEQIDQPTQAFSYLAGLKKLTRLNSDRQLGFRGAKVTVQEMLGMELGQYTHDAGARVEVNGASLFKIELKAQPERRLAFPRINVFFREADQTPVKFELYDERNELQKVVLIDEVKTIQNRMTITRLSIEDLQQNLKLKAETRKVQYDHNLSDKLFSEDYLKAYVSDASRKLDQAGKE